MENSKKEKKELETLLVETVDMLDDVRAKFGLFQKQRYYRFLSALDEFNKCSGEPTQEDDGR